MTTKRMTVKTFVDEGFLQELNRQFLHPMGLALGVEYPTDSEPDNENFKAFVIDARTDPQSIAFGAGVLDAAKATHVATVNRDQRARRSWILGWAQQTLANVPPAKPGTQNAPANRVHDDNTDFDA